MSAWPSWQRVRMRGSCAFRWVDHNLVGSGIYRDWGIFQLVDGEGGSNTKEMTTIEEYVPRGIRSR